MSDKPSEVKTSMFPWLKICSSPIDKINNLFDGHMREVISGTSISLVLRFLSAALSFCFNVMLGRLLGAEGAGVYFMALAVTTIAAVLGRIGLDNVLLRHVAASTAVRDWVTVKGVYHQCMRIAFTASFLMTIAVIALTPWVVTSVFSKSELIEPIQWMALSVVPLALLTLHVESLKGLKKLFLSGIVQGVGAQGLSLIGLLFLGATYGVKGAIWSYVAGTTVTALLAAWLWRETTSHLHADQRRYDFRILMHSSLPLLVVAVMDFVMNWTATLTLGIWGTNSDVGIFGVAYRTAVLTSFILMAVNSIAAPKFAELYKLRDMESLEKTARGSTRLMTLVAAPFLFLFLVVPEWILGIFGPQFIAGSSALAVLSVGQFVNVATGSVTYLLMMSGQERIVRNNMLISALLNVVLNLFLVPRYGIIGASLATALSVSWQNMCGVYLVRKTLGITTLPFMGTSRAFVR